MESTYAARMIIFRARFYSGGRLGKDIYMVNKILFLRRVPSRALTLLNFNISPYFPPRTNFYLLPSSTLLAQYAPTPSHKKNQYESIHTHCHINNNDRTMLIHNTISLIFIVLHRFNEPINSRDERQNSK